MSERVCAAVPYAAVATIALLVTRWFWWPTGYVVGFDTFAYSGPNLEFSSAALRDLRIPLVNDLIFGGTVHLGNPSAATLYPPHLLATVLGTNRAMGLLVTAHVVALGTGMVVLARRLGLGREGATVTGIVAVATGATLTKTAQFEQIVVIAWIPWLLVAIHHTFTTTRPNRAIAAMAVTVAGVLLAGHPQFVYETIVLAGASAVGFAVSSRAWRRIGHLAVGALVGACIAAPQLLAAALATFDSAIGGGRDLDSLDSSALALQTDSMPAALLGTVLTRDPAVFSGGFESIGYLGVVVAVIALVGLISTLRDQPSRPWAIAFGGVGVLATIWSLGPSTIVFRIAYAVLPGFDLARASARWIVIAVLIAAVFAGCGVDALVRARRRDLALIAGGATLVTAAIVGLGPFTIERPAATVWLVTGIVTVALVTWTALSTGTSMRHVAHGAVITVAVAELLAMSMHSIPRSLWTATPFDAHTSVTTEWLQRQSAGTTIALTDDGRDVAYQVRGLRPNANVLHGVASIDGYDGGVQVTRRWADALRRFQPEPDVDLPLRNALSIPVDPAAMARLGVRFILLDQGRPAELFVPAWTGPVAADEQFSVWENPEWIGDAVAWPAATTVDGEPADALRADASSFAATAIVDDPTATLTCSSDAPCGPIGLELERRTPEHLVVRTRLEVPTVVSAARQALPGWSVTVDGERADDVVVDGLFLGVSVPSGEHTIEWRYRSPWLRATLAVSALAVATTITLAATDTLRRRAASSRSIVEQPMTSFDA